MDQKFDSILYNSSKETSTDIQMIVESTIGSGDEVYNTLQFFIFDKLRQISFIESRNNHGGTNWTGGFPINLFSGFGFLSDPKEGDVGWDSSTGEEA